MRGWEKVFLAELAVALALYFLAFFLLWWLGSALVGELNSVLDKLLGVTR